MPDDKPFVPQFGPNGAVMNAQGLSDAKRREIEQSAKLSPGKLRMVVEMILTWIIGGAAGVWFLLAYMAPIMRAAELSYSPLVTQLVAGFMIALLTGGIAGLTRLELALREVLVRRAERRLNLPVAMRWCLVICDIGVAVALASQLLAIVAGLLIEKDMGRWFTYSGGVAAVLLISLSSGLREFVRRNGWMTLSPDLQKPANRFVIAVRSLF